MNFVPLSIWGNAAMVNGLLDTDAQHAKPVQLETVNFIV